MLRGLIRPISKEILESKFRIYYTVNADLMTDKTVTHKTPVPDHAHILVDVTTRQVFAGATRRSGKALSDAAPPAPMRETGTSDTNSGVVAWRTCFTFMRVFWENASWSALVLTSAPSLLRTQIANGTMVA